MSVDKIETGVTVKWEWTCLWN